MSELDKIAREDMTYGAMRQYGTVEVTEAPGLGLLEWVDTGPIIGMKALAGLVGKGGKGKSVSDYLGRIFKRARMEEQGKNILFEKFEGGESPRAIARKFYDEVYPNLNPDAQDKFKQWSQTGEHYPGATKEGKSIDVPFSEQVDDYIGETFPSMGALERGEDIIYDFIEGFGDNASSRGELVYMSILNDRYDEFIKTSGKGLSKLHKTAKTIFGTTDDVMEAGYIVNDGSMLDFSGANVGGTHGVRAYDHRQINLIGSYGRNHGLKGFDNIEMDEFIKSGGIRIDGVMNSVNMAVMPTDAQMKRLKNFYKKYQDSPKGWYEKKNWDTGETSFKEDEFLLHLERPGAEVLEHWSDLITKRVTRDTPWEDIEKHIKKVYREGAGEESTITKIIRQFRELGRGG